MMPTRTPPRTWISRAPPVSTCPNRPPKASPDPKKRQSPYRQALCEQGARALCLSANRKRRCLPRARPPRLTIHPSPRLSEILTKLKALHQTAELGGLLANGAVAQHWLWPDFEPPDESEFLTGVAHACPRASAFLLGLVHEHQ